MIIEGMTNEELTELVIELTEKYKLPYYTRSLKHFIKMLKEAVEKEEALAPQ